MRVRSGLSPGRHTGQLMPETGTGQRSPMEILQMDVFVWTVEIVRIPAPAKQQSIDSQNSFEAEYDRN